MGISGLIKFCEKAISQTTITEMRGKTVAVDSYCLLHRGAYGCSDKLGMNIKTNDHIEYALKYVKMLLGASITVIMVFDGQHLAAKAMTEEKRNKDRKAAKLKALELMKNGKTDEARKEFTKAVSITHEHAIELMKECRKLNVNCITAMYEADGQLCYLNKIGIAEYIISEDSDLIVFGCKKVIFKLSLDGRCLLYDSDKLYLSLTDKREKFSFEKFRRICIMSGCDYLNNLPGIGLAKASKFWNLTEQSDLKVALTRVPSYLNMKYLTVTQDYIEGFLRAEATFKYMYVFDPRKKEMVRLTELEDPSHEEYCINAGKLLSKDVAYQIALGNIDPRTHKKMDNYDPLKQTTLFRKEFKPPQTATFNLWIKEKLMKQSEKVQLNLKSFLNIKRAHEIDPEVQQIIDDENGVTTDIEVNDLINSYCVQEIKFDGSKRRSSALDEDGEIEIKSPRNPFAKRFNAEREDSSASNISLMKSISEQTESRIASRFFTSTDNIETKTEEQFEAERKNIEEMTRMNERELEKKLEENIEFYARIKPALREFVGYENSDSPAIDLDNYEEPKPKTEQKQNSIPVKSSKKNSRPVSDSTQSKLSRFGFQKRSVI